MSANLLPTQISVLRPTYSQDASFGITPTSTSGYSTVYRNVPASIQPANSSIRNMYAQRKQVVSTTIWVLTANFNILNGDVCSDGTNQYRVYGFRNLGGLGRCFAIDCEMIQ